jgi:glycyl-tRNA synthetase beta chain
MFGLGMAPSGSRDPFGLRRAAQGAVRIVLEGDLPLDLDLVAARATRLFGDGLELDGDAVLSTLRPFFQDRIRHLLGLRGYAYDEIEAGLAVGSSDLPDLRRRVEALQAVRREPDFLAVVLAAKRISNIVKDAPEERLDEGLLEEEAEKELHTAAARLRREIRQAQDDGRYEDGLRKIAEFAEVLEKFFVEVLVMDENRELRRNRIALLQSIQRILSRTAKLTEMVVDRAEARSRENSGDEEKGNE